MTMQHDIDPQRLTNELEPLISGTLVLMTAMQQPGCCAHIPAKIVSNLARLTSHPRLSTEFRMVLERLRLHWDARCSPAAKCPAEGPDQRAARLLH